MSTDLLYFSFSRARFARELADVFEKNEFKRKIKQRLFTGCPRVHFHDVLEQLKTNFIQIFASKGFLGLW